MDTIEKRVIHELGRCKVTVEQVIDECPAYDWLGEWTNYKLPQNKDEKLVHRETQSVLDHHGIWRDERGRMVPTPEEYSYSREYQYTFHSNGHDTIRYALQDHKRLEEMDKGYWCFIGIVATVEFDGAEIAQDSLWGIESDSGDYIEQTEREVARQALSEAREWRLRNL